MKSESQSQLDMFGHSEDSSAKKIVPLRNSLFIEFDGISRRYVKLTRNGSLVKRVDMRDKVARKLFILDAVDLKACKTCLADALGISRQTIDNYQNIRKHFGVEGLIQGYSIDDGLRRSTQRTIHRESLPTGDKARQVAEIRREAREEAEEHDENLPLNFSSPTDTSVPPLLEHQQPFAQEHHWEFSRYAGLIIYYITLVCKWRWSDLVIRHFGTHWPIFLVFLLMAGRNIRSVEQLKHVRSREAGVILGFDGLPSRQKIFEWFYSAAEVGNISSLLTDFFRYQLHTGLVGQHLWFTDGHLLPYTGQSKVHYAYNTQRQMPEPGQTNLVTCDEQGRIVDFIIEEGKGDLKRRVLEMSDRWAADLLTIPVSVFDREGYGAPNFSALVKANKPFVTWEKNVDTARLRAIEDERFSTHFTFNNKKYSVFEQQKSYTYALEGEGLTEGGQTQTHTFALRHLFIWNRSSGRRTCGVAYDAGQKLELEECVQAILSRWGASENTFKHIKVRHPFHYHPGFKLVESEKQDIANPAIKEKALEIEKLKRALQRLHKKMSHTRPTRNQDGSERRKSTWGKLALQQKELEASLTRAQDEKKLLPLRIDVSALESYRSFTRIDNEGKYMFDFVTASVWNARKQLVEWMESMYKDENDRVDLLYAIADCHGWVRTSSSEVTIRLEPLQQLSRRAAQEQLCRKLNGLLAQTPNGKRMVLEVGDSPLTQQERPKK